MRGVVNKKADVKIMQMAFMLVFVFIFFAFAFMFILKIQSVKMAANYNLIERENSISLVESVANMPELNCDSTRTLCLDEDKISVFSSVSSTYAGLWKIETIRIRKLYPKNEKNIRCPALNCSFYDIFNSGRKNVIENGAFVSICKKSKIDGIAQEICEMGKLSVGITKK